MMPVSFENRFYRNFASKRTEAFRVTIGQSDLFIRTQADLSQQARDALITARYQIERYIQTNVAFDVSLEPMVDDPLAPPIARKMLAAGLKAGVGPMAAVAGAIAEFVGEKLQEFSDEVIVENGGDLYLVLKQEMIVGVYAGTQSPFSSKLGLRVAAENTPCALCTSSGSWGHSFSFGQADAVTVLAADAALADAAATAIANVVSTPNDVEAALELAQDIEGVEGVAIFIDDKMGVWGDLDLVNLAEVDPD